MRGKTSHARSSGGFRAKQALGQNFLDDAALLDRLVSLSGVQEGDRVFEIGPGLGSLTEALARAGARVLAMEIDPQLIAILRVSLFGHQHIEVVEGDVMAPGLEAVLSPMGPFKIVANLPYYITTPIMNRLLNLELPIRSINVMVQKEAAQRLVAKPSTADYGPLSLLAQYKAEPDIAEIIGPEKFSPLPKCDSAFVLMPMRREPPVRADERKLFSLIDTAFRMRRKTLLNNMTGSFSLSRSAAEEVIRQAGLSSDIRGEALSLEEFARLSNLL